jgi:hypothetical protein
MRVGTPTQDGYSLQKSLPVSMRYGSMGGNKSKGTIPARPVTDRAITLGRNRDEERLLIHYM